MQPTLISTAADWRRAWLANWTRADLKSVRVAVAYCSKHGAAEIIARRNDNPVSIEFLVGLNDGVTDFEAREKLWQWSQNAAIEVRGTFKKSGRFHPKIYVFERAEEVRVMIGSVNLTHSAFYENSEAAIELVLSRDETLWHNLRAQLDKWWENGEPLKKPDMVEERIIDLMGRGVTVQAEVQIASLHAHFKEDVFEIGDNRFAQSGAVTIQRLNFSYLRLVTQARYDAVIAIKNGLHRALHRIAIPLGDSWFVPPSAYDDWKNTLENFKAELQKLLLPFETDENRAQQREIWLRELPAQIERTWAKFHGAGATPTPARLQQIVSLASHQFDAKSAQFTDTVRLVVVHAQHPLAAQLSYLGSSAMEQDLNRLAHESKEAELRRWVAALIGETRGEIITRINGVLNPNSKTNHKQELSARLKQLNFLEDTWADGALAVLRSDNGTPEDYKRVRDEAWAQLQQAQTWEDASVPMPQVLTEFASLVGWQS